MPAGVLHRPHRHDFGRLSGKQVGIDGAYQYGRVRPNPDESYGTAEEPDADTLHHHPSGIQEELSSASAHCLVHRHLKPQGLVTDPTGSRRFLCIEVKQKIDCTNLDINQVYAQLKTELANGERYWFTSEEELEIQEHNAAFRQVRPEEELLLSHYRIPMEGEAYEMLSLVEMLNELRSEYASLLRHSDYKLFGCFLQAAGMERVHTRQGNRYKVVRI